MKKTSLKLPSNQKLIHFREPTVEDCLNFCDLNEALDESSTTLYLNTIQDGDVQNSAEWTAQDRRLAIWWNFVTTSPDITINYEYPCAHCGETHSQLIDLADLDDEAQSLTVKPYIDDKILIDSVEHKIRLHPYNGYAMEHMEEVRNLRDSFDKNSPEYKKNHAELKVLEVIHSFDFRDDNSDDFKTELERKQSAVRQMSRINEFPALVAATIAAQEKLAHGLNTVFVDGQALVVSPPMPCERDYKGEAAPTSRLLLPFQGSAFIPTI